MLKTKHLTLIPGNAAHIEAFLKGRQELEAMLQVTIPPAWPEFPEGLTYWFEPLKSDPSLTGWAFWFVIHTADRAIAGEGGFKGKPDETGMVEIGYAIVPEYRGRGLATELAKGLTDWAFSHPTVTAVAAETLIDGYASIKVLEKLGMTLVETIHATEHGDLLRWQLNRPERQK